MFKLHTILATWFYSGYLRPASGTWGTLAALPLCVAVAYWGGILGLILGSMILFFVGLWAANLFEQETGEHDSSHIVIDEAAGMMVAALPLTIQFDWVVVLSCFVAFRAFDAVKIGPVGWLDKHVDGAFGVMVDDIAAGLMAAIIVIGGLSLWMI